APELGVPTPNVVQIALSATRDWVMFQQPLCVLRFCDLKSRGLVRNHTQLARLQQHYNFPKGRLVGGQTRVWTEEEITESFNASPTEAPPLKGAAKARKCRAREQTIAEVKNLDGRSLKRGGFF